MIAEYERARILERGRRGRRYAALSGAVSAMCGMPYGYRYIGRHAAGGVARIEIMEDEARVVRQLFGWIGIERMSLRAASRRLQEMGCPTRTGLGHWNATTIAGMLRNPAYRGGCDVRAHARGGTQGGKAAPDRRPARPAAGGIRFQAAGAPEEWIPIPVPAIVDTEVFEAAGAQLEENRRRKRDG